MPGAGLTLLHRVVLGTRRLPGFSRLYRGAYRLGAFAAARAFAAAPGAAGVILHRGLTRAGWEPGVSDIDLIVLLRPAEAAAQDRALRHAEAELCPQPGGERKRLERLGAVARGLSAAVPMLGDVWFATPGELERYQRWGGLRAREDPPDWRLAAGEAWPRAACAESELKRRRLDPWAWALVSHVEVSRRFLRPSAGREAKDSADLRKLFLDAWRYAAFAARGGPGELPLSRAEAARARPFASRASPEALWLESARLVSEASRKVLSAAGASGAARAGFAPASGLLEPRLSALRRAGAAAAAVCDPPYHTYLIVDEDCGDGGLRRAAAALAADPLSGVPLVVTPSTWALLLQSSYLGAPLGRLGASPEPEPGGGLLDGPGPCAVGEPPASERLPLPLRWEIAAEAASWMAVWWRSLWLGGAWRNRFVLMHLYTRALGLSLELAGIESGPWSRFDGLLERSAAARPGDAPFLESLARFAADESPECLDELPRAALAPEHFEALRGLMERLGATL